MTTLRALRKNAERSRGPVAFVCSNVLFQPSGGVEVVEVCGRSRGFCMPSAWVLFLDMYIISFFNHYIFVSRLILGALGIETSTTPASGMWEVPDTPDWV